MKTSTSTKAATTKTAVPSKVTKSQQESLDKLSTTSSKIRFLDSQGYTRSEIAKILNKRYQHIRNVLITPLVGNKKSK